MVICTSCATEAPDNAQECTHCGGRLFSSVDMTIAETILTPPARERAGQRRQRTVYDRRHGGGPL